MDGGTGGLSVTETSIIHRHPDNNNKFDGVGVGVSEYDPVKGMGSGPTGEWHVRNRATDSLGRRCCAGPEASLRRLQAGAEKLSAELRHMTRDVDVRASLARTCTLERLKAKLPIITWLPKYRLKHFQGDLIAGLTVGLTVIPQGLAYAKVAELSPEYGLYSAFMGCFIYTFLGTSKDITLGPTAIMSLLTAEFGNSPKHNDATYAMLLSLIGGIVQLVMGILHIGFVVDYISHPVINSFTTAAAITIAWGQVKKWLGLKKVPRDFIYDVYWSLKKIPETLLWDFLLGLSCLIGLYILKKMREMKWEDARTMSRAKKVLKYIIWLVTTSRNAIVVVIASAVSAGFLEYQLMPFSLTGTIKSGLPTFAPPSLTLSYDNTTLSATEVFSNIGAGFIILPLLGLVETIAIGKAFARKNNYNIDADQELLAIGASNIIGSFVGAYPVTGSFSRTAVNSQSGVMTPAGGIWAAVLVLLALAFLTPLFYYIPDAALAAVIIMAVIDMIDFTLLPKLWKIKKVDLAPWCVTFICCLLLGIEWGIVIGVGLSLLMLMYPYSRPQVQLELSYANNDMYEVLTVDQGLMFPGIEHFTEKVHKRSLRSSNSKSVILDMRSIANADYTSVEGIEQLIGDFTKQSKRLILCNMRPTILDIYKRAKLKNFVHARSIEEAIKLCQGGELANSASCPAALYITSPLDGSHLAPTEGAKEDSDESDVAGGDLSSTTPNDGDLTSEDSLNP